MPSNLKSKRPRQNEGERLSLGQAVSGSSYELETTQGNLLARIGKTDLKSKYI